MSLVAVTYHYIGDIAYPYSGIHPVGSWEFRWHIEHSPWPIADPRDLESYIPGEKAHRVIMFDDALAGQWYAWNTFMRRRRLLGVFFVPMRPYMGKACLVHKTHWLRAKLGPMFADRARRYLGGSNEEEARLMYPRDTPEDAMMKWRMIHGGDHEAIEALCDKLLRRTFLSEEQFIRMTYMSAEQILALKQAGNIIAAHGYSHLPTEPIEDMRWGHSMLEDFLDTKVTHASFPFGRGAALPSREEVMKLGFEWVWTTRPGVVDPGSDRTRLPRFDCRQGREGFPPPADCPGWEPWDLARKSRRPLGEPWDES